MNFKQINPNAQTLGQMISLVDFVDYFSSANSDVIQYAMNNNQLNPNGSGFNWQGQAPSSLTPPSTYSYLWNWPTSCQLISCPLPVIVQGQTSYTPVNTMTSILATIYNMFKNSIPYDQTTTANYYIMVFNYSTADWTPTPITLPNVLQQISAYLDVYVNVIMEYNILQFKYMIEGNVMIAGATNNLSQGEQMANNYQNNGYSGNTFNPVNMDFTPQVQPMPLNQGASTFQANGMYSNSLPNGYSTQFTANNSGNNPTMQGFQGGINLTGLNNLANANVHGSANASTGTHAKSYQQVNLQYLEPIGTQQVNIALKPLFYKISTLFWTLGNDNYPDNETWGFNIW